MSEMEKTFDPKSCEEKIYKMWETGGYFTPKIDSNKKPFSILLPLPNASDPMHIGHALFTIQDILSRYHRMKGEPTLWLPGGDHAGIETQFVFEKHLAKEGKSRFDFDRDTLYKMIWEYTQKYKDLNKDQMKRLGFSLDWTRYHYSLEPKIIEKVFDTFRKLDKDGLIYRGERLVNMCVRCGTAFSDLECDHEEREGNLYYLNYDTISIATTRPETVFADVAIAVNLKDKRFKDLIGKMATVPLIDKKIPIISDIAIKTDFGTGALKVTPAHDAADFEIGTRHKLPVISCIDRNGRLINVPDKYLGKKASSAREEIVADLESAGFLIKTEPITHTVSLCYRCHGLIEPLLSPQWYVKTKGLAKPVVEAIKCGKTKIVPKKRFEKMFLDWMENILDWNISRQIVWGPRIPAWYCLDCNSDIHISLILPDGLKVTGTFKELKEKYSIKTIRERIQSLISPVSAGYQLNEGVCSKCQGANLIQETDTFDTWFLSGQWPLSTLGFPDSPDFKYFYPTSVLDTLWDILLFWVARMMMLGIYRSGETPFKTVHIHARVVDKNGKKMSKSKGNGVDPVEMIEKYGADALRMTLVFGVAPASDVVVSEDKVRAMRNFANKVWNIGRFLEWQESQLAHKVSEFSPAFAKKLSASDTKLLKSLKLLTIGTTKALDNYQFSHAAEMLYEFIWHTLADDYVEEVKNREDKDIALSVLRHAFLTCLKLLHPFMPFVTEEIWEKLNVEKSKPLIVSSWPEQPPTVLDKTIGFC